MVSASRKKSSSSKKKKKKNPNQAGRFLIFLSSCIGIILLVELGFYLNNQSNLSKEFLVQTIGEFDGQSQSCGPFKAWDVLATSDGIALTDQGGNRILRFDRQGKFLSQIDVKQSGQPEFKEISCLTADLDGNIFGMDAWNGLIRGFDNKNQSVLRVDLKDKGFYGPRGVAWDNGKFLIADTGSHRVVKVSQEGLIESAWGHRGSSKGNFDNPYQVVVDTKHNYYILDRDNERIQRLDDQGHFVSEIKLGFQPASEAIDPQRNLLYVSSLDAKVVKVFTLEGKWMGILTEI
ncbi:MAG TPA: NHL repeat-containing protein, partial [bacterium]